MGYELLIEIYRVNSGGEIFVRGILDSVNFHFLKFPSKLPINTIQPKGVKK